ncbi:MAG TPA: quinone oxidoreductase [Anaerolineae bacterium]|nr:quinone oxidoreductase [Anaerolineae bacterium]HMR64402.1 quinone oxidoreductase [Anaerolineae bacterium]
MNAIRVHQPGGPEVMQYEALPTPEPQSGEVLVKVAAAGVNFIDVYHRTGLYPKPLPFTLGMEAAGVVEAVGPEVTAFKVGDHVAFASAPGAYAEYCVAPVNNVVPVPQGLDLVTAAASMLQGMTAHFLLYSTYPVKAGDTVLVHAAAGGVGSLLVQLAKQLGATVIGTVSTEEKAQLALEAGADHIIRYTEADFEAETKRLTEGQGVEVVYDSVGQSTFDKSLNVLKPRGYMVLFGQSSGKVPPFDPGVLGAKGSLFITRPSLFHYIAKRDDLLWRAGDLFKWLEAGQLKLRIDRQLALAEAAEAHRLLESRQTAGKVLLIP